MRALKCLTLVTVVVTAAMVMVVPAMAGDYHSGTELVCSDCHTMHYSVSHAYDGTAAPGDLAGGPNPRLLKQPANDLCLACHDGQESAPDVLGNNTTTLAYVRQAGALNKLTGNDAGYEVYMGHTLGSTAQAPGSSPAWSDSAGLNCTDCHGAHNNPSSNTDVNGHTGVSAWRNVNRRAGNSSTMTRPNLVISYETGTNTGAYDIFETDATLGQISTHYDISNMSMNEPVTTDSGVSQWCMKCHTNFHAVTADSTQWNGTDWLRHPTAEANFTSSIDTRYNGLTNKVPVMGSGALSRTPTCLTCHKAHGNKNAFGLIQMSGTGTVSEEGDSSSTGMRDLCRQCHLMGGAI